MIRNSLLRSLLIAVGGADLITGRNDYLTKIAESLGTTVRNPNVSNMILEDILAKYLA